MTKLYAVLVGSLLLAGGSSAMARPDADDTLTQIHWLPNDEVALKPVFRFGRRLQVDVGSDLAGMAADDATNIVQAGAEQVAQEAVNATLSASGMSQQQAIGQAAADDVAKVGVDAGVSAIADAIGGPFG